MTSATPTPALARWLKTTLTWLAAVLLFLFVFIFAVFMVLRNSTSSLEFVLEQVVGRVLDRELQIGEVLEAKLGLDSYLLARDVSLANPAWAKEPDFASAARVMVHIDIPSIWRDGPVVLTELELTEATVSLLAPQDHPATWNFWPEKAGPEVIEQELDKALEPIFPLRIRKGHIDGGELVYRDTERDIALSIDDLALRETSDDAHVYLDISGAINETPLAVTGKVGPSAALLTWQDISMDLALRLGELKIDAKGTIADLEHLSGPDLHVKVAGQRSRPLLDIIGLEEVRDGSLTFEGHVTDAHPGLSVSIKGDLAEYHIQLSGKLADPLALDGVDISFNLKGPSMAELGVAFKLAGLPEAPFEAAGDIRRLGADLTLAKGVFAAGAGRLEIEGHLPEFPGINDWELTIDSDSFNLEMLGPLVGAEGLPAIPYQINGSLESNDEGVELVDLRIQSPQSSLILNGVVGEAPRYFGTRIHMALQGTDMAAAGLWFGLHDLPGEAYRGEGDVSFSDRGWQLSDSVLSTPTLELGVSATADKLPNPSRLETIIEFATPALSSTLDTYGFASAGIPALPLSLNASLSGSPALLHIDALTASLGDSRVKVSGVLGDTQTFAGLDIQVDFQTPDLLRLLPDRDDDLPLQLPVDTHSQLVMSAEGVAIKAFQGQFGEAEVVLKGLFNVQPPHDNSQFSVNAKGPDLGKLLAPWLERDIPKTPFLLSMDTHFTRGGVGVKQLEASAADARLSGHFEIDNLEELTGGQGKLELSGDSSLNLARILGIETSVPDADYSVSINIQQSPEWLRLDPVALRLGKGDLTGKVDIQAGDRPAINADLHSKFVNLPFLLPNRKKLEEAGVAAGASSGSAMETDVLTAEELAERIIPDDPIDFSWLNKVRASIKYQVDEIYLGDDAKSSAAIHITLADGVFSSKQLSWDGTFIEGDVQLTVRALEQGAEIEFYLDAGRLPFLLMLGGAPRYDPDAVYRARITTSGSSLRELAARSNGVLAFIGGGGRLDNKGLDLIMGDTLEEVMNRINPFSETDTQTRVVCHAGAVQVNDGKVSIDPGLILRTKKMDIALAGSVDMHRERLDITFNSHSRKGIGISAGKAITPYFKVGGTMANPRMVVDPKGVALSGGAAVATAGLSILAEGLWDRWIATAKNPCKALITKISTDRAKIYQELLEPPS